MAHNMMSKINESELIDKISSFSTTYRPKSASDNHILLKRIEELEEQVRRLSHENYLLKFETQLLKQNVENKNKKIAIK